MGTKDSNQTIAIQPLGRIKAILSDDRADSKISLDKLIKLKLKGLSYRKISELTGMPFQTIYSRLGNLFKLIDKDRLDAFNSHKIDLLRGTELTLMEDMLDETKRKKATLGNTAYSLKQIHDIRQLAEGKATSKVDIRKLSININKLSDREAELNNQISDVLTKYTNDDTIDAEIDD